MFSEGGKKLSKSDLEKFLKLTEKSNFKYFIKSQNGPQLYCYKGQLRANDSTAPP
jgi:hypothetical protein